MSDAVWFRAVCERKVWPEPSQDEWEPHTGPHFTNASQCRADVLRHVDGEEWVVMPEPDIPDDPTEVFDD